MSVETQRSCCPALCWDLVYDSICGTRQGIYLNAYHFCLFSAYLDLAGDIARVKVISWNDEAINWFPVLREAGGPET
jgi:hypothetical protein